MIDYLRDVAERAHGTLLEFHSFADSAIVEVGIDDAVRDNLLVGPDTETDGIKR